MTGTTPGIDSPMERAVMVTTPFLAVGLLAALPLLLVSWSAPPFAIVIVHLTGLVLLGLLHAVGHDSETKCGGTMTCTEGPVVRY